MIKHFYVGRASDDEPTQIPADAIDIIRSGRYGVKKISGLTRPKADVNRSALAGANASRISGAQITERNIVLDVDPHGDEECNRLALYDILPFDTILRFYIETDQRTVYIDGYVEEIDGDDVAGRVFGVQNSIICPFPWFQSVRPHSVNLVVGDNTVRYDGDIPAGFMLNVPAQESPPLVGSVGDLAITIGGKTFAYSGNVSIPTICTIPGKKRFTGSRKSTGSEVSTTTAPAFGVMTAGCQWPMLDRNNKTVTVSCSAATQEFFEQQNVFSWRDTYSGV